MDFATLNEFMNSSDIVSLFLPPMKLSGIVDVCVVPKGCKHEWVEIDLTERHQEYEVLKQRICLLCDQEEQLVRVGDAKVEWLEMWLIYYDGGWV